MRLVLSGSSSRLTAHAGCEEEIDRQRDASVLLSGLLNQPHIR